MSTLFLLGHAFEDDSSGDCTHHKNRLVFQRELALQKRRFSGQILTCG